MPEGSYRVAVIKWAKDDEIAESIAEELAALRHSPQLFLWKATVPEDAQVVFSFGPYGRFLHIPRQLARIPADRRPVFVHWNTEGMPDLRLPWRLMSQISSLRSSAGRLWDNSSHQLGHMVDRPPLSWLQGRVARFRYVGDYRYAFGRGWLDVLANSSAVYSEIQTQNGLPTLYAPWGGTRRWHGAPECERDIDVLWVGKRATRRRSTLLDRVRNELAAHGVRVHVVDGMENPFIFGDDRNRMFNRSQITLNLTRTWYDDNFSRFAMAAPNRSLIVSETLLPHCPCWKPGTHYVSAAKDDLAETILYYLAHPGERQRIVDNAYRLVTTELTFGNGIKKIMDAAARVDSTTIARPAC